MAGELPKRAASFSGAMVWDWFKNWAWTLFPTVPSVVAFVNARMQDFPLWLALLLGALIFWASMSGLAAARSFWARASANSKLVAPGLAMGHGVNDDGRIQRLNIGVRLANISELMIEYQVLEIRTVLNGRVNPAPDYENRGAIVQPMCETMFWDSPVPIEVAAGERIEGTFEVKIAYGKVGMPKHQLTHTYKIVATAGAIAPIDHFMWFTK